MISTRFNYFLKLFTFTSCLSIPLCGCARTSYGLSTSEPTEIDIWTYYNGAAGIAFDELVARFNSTIGKEQDIVVYCQTFESADALEQKIQDANIGKIGSDKIPDIFQCYPENAIKVNNYIGLVNLDDYVPDGVKDLYVRNFLDAGSLYIGDEKQWVIFPVAKSSELLILNKTDWNKFSSDTGADLEALSTWEGLLSTAKDYYEWSGSQAFLGIDSLSDFLICSSSQLGASILDGEFEEDVMYRLWNYSYIPYIQGYYSYEPMKYGNIIASIASSDSVTYLPDEISYENSASHQVEYSVLTLPYFERTAPYAILDGSGMAVTKSDEAHEYASVVFLEWITQNEENMTLALSSGYMPVTVEGVQSEYLYNYFEENKVTPLISDTINLAIYQNQKYIMYSIPESAIGFNALDYISTSIMELSINDRELILQGEDINSFLSKDYFDTWYSATYLELMKMYNQ